MEGNGRIDVSRDLLHAELSSLELRLIERVVFEIAKKADREDVNQLSARVRALEARGPLEDRMTSEFSDMRDHVDGINLDGSASAQRAIAELVVLRDEVAGLMTWRSRMFGAYAVLLIAVGTIGPLLGHYL